MLCERSLTDLCAVVYHVVKADSNCKTAEQSCHKAQRQGVLMQHAVSLCTNPRMEMMQVKANSVLLAFHMGLLQTALCKAGQVGLLRTWEKKPALKALVCNRVADMEGH